MRTSYANDCRVKYKETKTTVRPTHQFAVRGLPLGRQEEGQKFVCHCGEVEKKQEGKNFHVLSYASY